MISAGELALVSWSSGLLGYVLSPSVNVEEVPPDPLINMGFDLEFLPRLSDRYNELPPPDMENVHFEAAMDNDGKGKQLWMYPVWQTPPLIGVPASDTLAAIFSKEGFPPPPPGQTLTVLRYLHSVMIPRNFDITRRKLHRCMPGQAGLVAG
jgi:hypothetical protein